MSLEVDLGEFLSAYLAEADEHIATANAKLLAIERAVRAGTTDARALRDLFRTLHTLKGLSAMVGVDPVVALAHGMESIVRAGDRAGQVLGVEAVEALFDALKAITERLAALARGETAAPAPQALLDRLDAAPLGSARASRSGKIDLDPEIDAKLAAFEREQLVSAARDGKRALRVDFTPSPARAGTGLTISRVRERLAELGEIVKVVPIAVEVTEAAPGGLRFALLVTTTADDAAIVAATGGTTADITLLSADPESQAPPAELREETDELGPNKRGILRVDVGRVDDAMDRLSLLLVTRSRLSRAVTTLTQAGAPTRELQLIVQEATRQLRDLRAAILSLRMVPVAEVLARLPLVVRSLERANGKDIRLVTEANDAELDKTVAERIFPALVHLLRNAIDHGIEAPHVRLERSKPPQGTVRISCAMASNRLVQIRVADDGGGIDPVEIAKSAGHPVAKTGAAILDVLCRPGVSTRREATATSGRGMGMDIVRRIVVDELGGELDLDTTPGEGTIFTLRIPLTLAVLEAFTVECGGEIYAVPVASVEEIVEVEPAKLIVGPGGHDGEGATTLFSRRGEAVPIVHLAQALGRQGGASADARQALVVRRSGEPIAFRLDRVRGQQETVVRPLLDPLVQAPGIAGCADLGDGRATLVLDLLALAGRVGTRQPRLGARA